MKRNRKGIVMAKNQHGYTVKAWISRVTGIIMPTNWKIQSLHLSGSIPVTKRQQNRHERNKRERAIGVAKWLEHKNQQVAVA